MACTKSVFKFVIAALLILTLGITLLLGTFVFLPDRYVQRGAEIMMGRLTDHNVSIGTLALQRSLTPTLELTDVTVANAEWSERPHLLAAERLGATISLLDLLRGIVHIDQLSADGLNVYLEKNLQGNSNWSMSTADTPSGQIVSIPDFSWLRIDRSTINSFKVEYRDQQIDRQESLVLETIEWSPEGEGDSLTQTLEAKGTFSEQSLAVSMSLPRLVSLRSDELPVKRIAIGLPVDIKAQLGALILTANGEVDVLSADQVSSGLNLGVDVDLQLTSPDAKWLFDAVGSDRLLPGSLDLKVHMTGRGSRYDITLERMELQSELINAKLSGTVSDVLNMATAVIDVKVVAPDMAWMTPLVGQPFPSQWGPFNATALIEGSKDGYALTTIDATLDGQSKAEVSGSILNLFPLSSMALDVKATLASLNELSTFTTNPLPDVGPLVGTGIVQWQDGKLALTEAKASYKGSFGTAVATGKIGDLVHFDEARIRLDIDAPDFSVVELFTQSTLPAVAKVTGSANLITISAGDLSARNVKLSVTQANTTVLATGTIDSIFRSRGEFDLALSAEADSLIELQELVGITLPDIGPLKATARLSGAGQTIKLVQIAVELNDPVLTGSALSDGASLNQLDTLVLDVELATPSLSETLSVFDVASVIDKPATLSGLVSWPDGVIKLGDLDFAIDDNQLTGNLSITMPKREGDSTKTTVEGNITVTNLNVLELVSHAVESQTQSNDGLLLPDQPIPFDWITWADLDITLNIDKYQSALFEITNATLPVRSENARLRLGPFAGTINTGTADLDLVVDASSRPANIDVSLTLHGIDVSRAGLVNDSGSVENIGGTDVSLSLNSQGESVASIMAAADAHGSLYINNLMVKQDVLRLLSSDLLTQIVKALNPFDKVPEQTRFSCVAARFDMQEGTLTTPYGYALEAEDFSVIGDGSINFADETLDLGFQSIPTKGLGIGLNKLSSLVKLEGPLVAPELTFNENGVLRFGTSLAATVYTSGLSLLAEGLWDRVKANSDLCAEAYGE